MVVLLACTVNRLVQGHGLEGAALDFLVALWLLAEHKHFTVTLSGVSRYVSWLLAVGLAAAVAVAFIEASFQSSHDEALDVVLFLIFGALLIGTLVVLPGRESRLTGKARRAAFDRTKAIIEQEGGRTFDYFALRDDKSWFFTGNTVVAYSVIEGVMLVAPDPIGPVDERASAWADTMDFSQSRGFELSVLAASIAWLPIYRAAGMVDHFAGNEAVIDCLVFSLGAKSMKPLRESCDAVSKAGYRVEVLDPLVAPPELRRAVLDLLSETEDGEMEHGYWMTLSRMFDSRDTGLLLAVCFDPDGQPVAFNQYVPAPLVEGYSLDTMRRKPATRRAERSRRLRARRNHQVDGGARLPGSRAQLRHRQRSRRRRRPRGPVGVHGPDRAPSLQRRQADRVAREVQQEVRPGMDPSVRDHRATLPRSTARSCDRPRRGDRPASRGRPSAPGEGAGTLLGAGLSRFSSEPVFRFIRIPVTRADICLPSR